MSVTLSFSLYFRISQTLTRGFTYNCFGKSAWGGGGGGRTDHIINITEEVHGPALIKEGFI